MYRPTSCEVLSHCLFWSKEKQLSFYQDVSDRIEKESSTSAIVQALEQGGLNVVKGDWRTHISEELRDGKKHVKCVMLRSLFLSQLPGWLVACALGYKAMQPCGLDCWSISSCHSQRYAVFV